MGPVRESGKLAPQAEAIAGWPRSPCRVALQTIDVRAQPRLGDEQPQALPELVELGLVRLFAELDDAPHVAAQPHQRGEALAADRILADALDRGAQVGLVESGLEGVGRPALVDARLGQPHVGDAPHLHNEIGEFNEVAIAHRRDRSGAEVVDQSAVKDVAAGPEHVGLITRLGPVPQGYYKDEDATRAAFLPGEDLIADYAERFGYGQRIQVPMTASASNYPKGMDAPQLMLSSFGQSNVRVTPLQIAMISAAIANGGQLMQPTLIESVIAPDLTVIEPFQEEVFSEPISAQTAATVAALMVNNVSNGAAGSARISGVEVGGKTGTAQNSEGSANTLWFTGFAPASDPQIAIAVVVENEEGFGDSVASPIARKVIEAVLSK